MRLAATICLAPLLAGCPTDIDEVFNTCTIDLALEVTEARPGDEVLAIGTPLSPEIWDSRLQVGGVKAEILSITRDACTSCDNCRIETDCLTCDDCPACETLCEPCEESLLFAVPQLTPGEHEVILFNRHGGSRSIPLQVLASDTDTSPVDTARDTASGGEDSDTPDTDASPSDSDTDGEDTDAPSADSDTTSADTDSSVTDSVAIDTSPGDSDTSTTDSAAASDDTDTDAPDSDTTDVPTTDSDTDAP